VTLKGQSAAGAPAGEGALARAPHRSVRLDGRQARQGGAADNGAPASPAVSTDHSRAPASGSRMERSLASGNVEHGTAARARAPRKSRWPARLDLAQSASGLLLGLFMWAHMAFVSTILVSPELMWAVTKMFEGYFIFGRAYPVLVSLVVAAVFALFIAHAGLALRKFPASFAQYRAFGQQAAMLRHPDTTLWLWQVGTGFLLFFLASAHLVQMLMQPGLIGPYESAERVWNGRWWPIYLVMLFAVEIHGGIGLYRLAVKWDFFGGADPADPVAAAAIAARTRRRLKRLKWGLSVFFIVLGLATLAAYMKLGYEIRHADGPRYVPAWLQNPPQADPPRWWPSWIQEAP
jgi:fumarate reductase subunit C